MLRITTVMVLTTMACSAAAPSTYLIGPAPMEPPGWYAEVWRDMIDCAGPENVRNTDLSRVRWRVADTILSTPDGTALAGFWRAPHNIYLQADFTGDPRVVGHEMLHELLGVTRPHADSAFLRCDPLRTGGS